MITMSNRCPICGCPFTEGEKVKNGFAKLPFGLVAMSFHERCFVKDRERADDLLRQAVETAVALVFGGSSQTPPVIH